LNGSVLDISGLGEDEFDGHPVDLELLEVSGHASELVVGVASGDVVARSGGFGRVVVALAE